LGGVHLGRLLGHEGHELVEGARLVGHGLPLVELVLAHARDAAPEGLGRNAELLDERAEAWAVWRIERMDVSRQTTEAESSTAAVEPRGQREHLFPGLARGNAVLLDAAWCEARAASSASALRLTNWPMSSWTGVWDTVARWRMDASRDSM
jgi:hypothetical protein